MNAPSPSAQAILRTLYKTILRLRRTLRPFFYAVVCFCCTIDLLSASATAHPADCLEEGGQTICVKPIPTAWEYRLCDEVPSYIYRSIAWCASSGGVWGGSNQGCSIDVPVQDASVYPRSQAFAQYLHGTCTGVDSEWGQSLNSYFCYRGSPLVVSGYVLQDYRQMTFSCGPNVREIVSANRSRKLACPAGYQEKTVGLDLRCVRPIECCTVSGKGNPVSPASGVKTQVETDYAHRSGLALTRHYHAFHFNDPAAVGDRHVSQFGSVWRSNFDRHIVAISDSSFISAALLTPTGHVQYFDKSGAEIVHLGGSKNQLVFSPSGYRYALPDRTETYDASGKLVGITSLNGQVQTLVYSTAATLPTTAPHADLLVSVTDNWGHQIRFMYDHAAQVVAAIDPAEGTIRYAYDEETSIIAPGRDPVGNLTSVTFQDGKVRRYWYNEPAQTGGVNLPNALTGITDENGVRYATYTYDATGRAIATEHAGGVERYSFVFGSAEAVQTEVKNTVIDPLGTSQILGFALIKSVLKQASETQAAGAGSAATLSTTAYDLDGNVASHTDFNGVTTAYQYDAARQLETRRTEASGLPQAHTISTEWHPILRLPIRIAEPKRLISMRYDTFGNLLSRTMQATSDETGAAAFNATPNGAPQIWSTNWSAFGQMLSTTGPRSDTVDRTTFAYDTSGNLTKLTNAAAQITTFDSYDANGQLLVMTDPNDTVTKMTYAPRGWLLTSTATTREGDAQTTTFSYDSVGQIKMVVFGDGHKIAYAYDDAHRLNSVSDGEGNTIATILDAMGNRIKETATGSTGAIARSTARVFDALNRLQQVTGGVQ